MRRITREQCDVYLLHLEIIECSGSKAMDHAAHAHIQRPQHGGANYALDWAMDYSLCHPEQYRDIIMRAHTDEILELTPRERGRLGVGVREFYREVARRGLYGYGLRLLRRK